MGQSDILSGIFRGDEETYIHLFKEYYVGLCSYSRRYVGRVDVAEEIVSDVFMRLWERRKQAKITGSIKSYLFQAVCNNSLNYLRNLKKEESIDEYFNNTDSGNIGFATTINDISSETLILEDLKDKLQEAIDLLPPQQKKAFMLKRFEGKKNKEIARIMNISIKTVEMHLSKAMTKLRDSLKDILPTFLLFILLRPASSL